MYRYRTYQQIIDVPRRVYFAMEAHDDAAPDCLTFVFLGVTADRLHKVFRWLCRTGVGKDYRLTFRANHRLHHRWVVTLSGYDGFLMSVQDVIDLVSRLLQKLRCTVKYYKNIDRMLNL